ncbi:sensor histidine kinase [Fluviicola taffensis]|uniref:histidine kinase n=1 Tax=Fluviicola taffensis (strain DSM 16823 / NCIMB 13979 / RW262) TaxID=755732 RepID=F2IDS8_FLUTR|nr:sensor histidine kinase [Fluviicola taffensis]AEA44470.1 signal transduction histidine kinase [Fluviicola taffensis DSM 16823]
MNQLITILIIIASTSVCGQNKAFDHRVFDQEIDTLQNELIIDISKANLRIRKLDSTYKQLRNPEISYLLALKKIKFHGAYGDLARVKFEINKAKRFLFFFKAKAQDKLYLDLYTLVYENANKDYSKLIRKVNILIDKSDPIDRYFLMQCHLVLASSYNELGDFDHAIQEIESSKKIAGQLNNEAFEYNVSNSAGQIYFFKNSIKNALVEFEAAKKMAQKNKWKYLEQYSNSCIGEVYLYSGQLDIAKSYFDLVLKNEEKTELRDLYQLYGCLEYYYELKNNSDSSYYYSIKRNETDDLLEDLRNENLVFELEKDFQLESQKYLLDEEKNKNQQLRFILVLILICIVIIISVSYLFIRQKSDSNRLLYQQKAEIDQKNKEISNSLSIKESLLKEIHHRVKNNLQVVSSILNLQARNVKDPEALRIIEEGKERIRAIALIHNQLHLNDDSAYVEMGSYLNKLINQMGESFSSYNKKIVVKVNVEEINLAIDYAVPVGLILCELLSNSYKHAFKNREEGTIEIELKNNPEKSLQYELQFKDNGVGYSGKTAFLEQSSTGVEIIGAFIQQLDANYSYINQEDGFGMFIQFTIADRHSKDN